ncbi:MAG: glycerophosphodiester phosphodiesterase [Clostridiales bacterium]|jgi:glycerophosphoryl diester phosphodiesterase|nr:glycerophosphodiester phosphodiesterase [Clostridiales bacterium]
MFGQTANNILVAGHRGMAALFPENTMAGFAAAHKAGVDMIETDLNVSNDGALIVIHDRTVDRTADGAGEVRSLALSELKKLDAGAKFGPQFAGERIVSFDEFLEFVKTTDLTLNVEIKDYAPECTDKAVKALRDARLDGRYVLACFGAKAVEYAHTVYGVPIQGFPARFMQSADDGVYAHLYSVGVPLGALNGAEYPDCRKGFFEKRGIDYWTYCPDCEADVIKCVQAGTTLMTCNDPFPAMKYLKENKLRKR